MTSAIEAAWAAGLFEGEGCIAYKQRTKYPNLTLSMTDSDVVERFAAIVGVGTLGKREFTRPENAHHKTQYRWSAGSIEAIRHVAALFLPYLGERRRRKLLDVLDAYNSADVARRHKDRCPSDHPYNEENTRYYNGTRYCRECNRLKAQAVRDRVAA